MQKSIKMLKNVIKRIICFIYDQFPILSDKSCENKKATGDNV